MKFLKKIHKILSEYIDVSFFLKFVILMACIYYFNIFYIGLADPKGLFYSSFVANNLDYISWLRSSILYASNFATKVYGLNTYVADVYTLKVMHGRGVIIGLTCIGYGLMSFWTAFIIAQHTGWKKKLKWCIAGIAAIWFINCCRISILLIALQNKWEVNKYIDHHDMFNVFAYLLIILMIYLYHRSEKQIVSSHSREWGLKMAIRHRYTN